jgi:hypothetical protein
MYTLIRENVERIVDDVDKAAALIKEGFRYVDKKEVKKTEKKFNKKVVDNNDGK